MMTFMEVSLDVFLILHKSRVSQLLSYQVPLSSGNCYTLLIALKGD